MRTHIFFICMLLSGLLHAQRIDNPSFKARKGNIFNVTAIERTPEETRLSIHAIFRPHWWISLDKEIHLIDADTQTKYNLKRAENFKLNEKNWMPDSGTKDFLLVFDPLPKKTQSIHLINPNDNETDIFHLSLIPEPNRELSLLNKIEGNWFADNDTAQWICGIFDSICVVHNKLYQLKEIRKKGKRIAVKIWNKEEQRTSSLLFKPMKGDKMEIEIDETKKHTCQSQRPLAKAIAADNGFQHFFSKDTTTCLQGYIRGYDSLLGFANGIVYLENIIRHESMPRVVEISPDGSFRCQLPITHPIESHLTINNNWIPFYIEPGQTLTLYIDWEEVMKHSRSRRNELPIQDIHYMGPSASLAYLLYNFTPLIHFPFDDIYRSQNELPPQQYKEHIHPFILNCQTKTDSVCHIFQASKKACQLIRNKTALQTSYLCLEYEMMRDHMAKENPSNAALQVPVKADFYDFLKPELTNEITILADEKADIWINRFEYMNIITEQNKNAIPVKVPRFNILTFYKGIGIKLTPAEEKLREKYEKNAGKIIFQSMQEIMMDNKTQKRIIQMNIEEIQKNGHSNYNSWVAEQTEKNPIDPIVEEGRDNETVFNHNISILQKQDSIIELLCTLPHPYMWQIAQIRNLRYSLRDCPSKEYATIYFNKIKSTIEHPVLHQEAQCIFEEIFPEKNMTSYTLPEGKATEIFRNIVKNHPGKALFIDFWATSCGPCRSGIEATAELRKTYKNHPDFQFIYITSENDSPHDNYKAYVEKNLKGEACYYLNGTDYNYLRQLFKFSAIPYYVFMNKDGSILKQKISSYDIQTYLQENFPIPQSEEVIP